MNISIKQVYAVVRDYADYRGKYTTEEEVKAFVDDFLSRQKPKPTDCQFVRDGKCGWAFGAHQDCPGLSACSIKVRL